MKKLFLLFTAVFIVAGCAVNKPENNSFRYFNPAKKFLMEKDFFRARDYIAKNKVHFTKFHSLVVNAYLNNAFNRLQASNDDINLLFKEYAPQLPDSLKIDLLRIKQGNHVKLFEYLQADETINSLLAGYSGKMSEEEIDDYTNMGVIWSSLSGQPKQEVIIHSHTVIKMSRDKAGLANLEVKANAVKTDFIFDTGANLSTVTETTAAKLNMKLLEGSIEVGSITGAIVQSGLAICPELSIGNITVRNAVFLVFPDTALAFPQIDYQINGIIGFPVIEAMKEIQITREDEFTVPKSLTPYSSQNMALDFLTPIIAIDDEHYTFDTGATGTSLYKKYFDKHKGEITGKYAESDIEFGGAGGMLTKKGYTVVFSPTVNGSRVNIQDVEAFSEDIQEKESPFYGNIGQDVIRQFRKMTINFESMFIRFD